MFKIIKRIIKDWPKQYKKRLYIGCVYSFFISIASAMPIIGAAHGLNLVILDMHRERSLSTRDVLQMLGFMILTVLFRYLFTYLQAITQESIIYEVTAVKRIKIGDILKRVSLGFFEKNNAGEIAGAVTTDLSFFEMHGMGMIDTVINGYIYIATIFLSLMYYSLPIALISLVGILLSALFLKLLGNKSAANAPIHQKAQDDMIASTLEYIRGMAVVKAFKQDGVAREGIRKAYGDSCDINIQIERDYVVFNCLHKFSLKIAATGIMLTAALFTANGNMTLSTMLMMIIFSFVMFSHLERLSDATHVLENIDVTMDKLERIECARFIDSNCQNMRLSSYDITFENVTFAYDRREVLKNVSFTIPENTTTAIVGPSGSGKTTICSLIARFYDVNIGKVLVGGIDVKQLTCDSLLANISMVFQKVYLFHDTVLNNIRFGKPDAALEEEVETAKKARCHDFIMNLPNGYETIIGEGGSSLSGGEKQRISIARAMLKNAPIVILDEATANVDPENEHEIQNAISELVHGKTIIIIAHRLATIRNADQILVVDKGQISNRGTHDELIREEGVYKRFMEVRETAEGWSI